MPPGKVESRPWGRFVVLHKDHDMWLKRLIIAPGASLSLQYHENREEYWLTHDVGVRHWYGRQPGAWVSLPPGVVRKIARGEIHRLENASEKTVIVTEWAVGRPDENDIVRLADDYGRANQSLDN